MYPQGALPSQSRKSCKSCQGWLVVDGCRLMVEPRNPIREIGAIRSYLLFPTFLISRYILRLFRSRGTRHLSRVIPMRDEGATQEFAFALRSAGTRIRHLSFCLFVVSLTLLPLKREESAVQMASARLSTI